MGARILFRKRDGRLVLDCSECGEVGGELDSDDARRRLVAPHIAQHRDEPPAQRQRERAALALLPDIVELLLSEGPECELELCETCAMLQRIRALLEAEHDQP